MPATDHTGNTDGDATAPTGIADALDTETPDSGAEHDLSPVSPASLGADRDEAERVVLVGVWSTGTAEEAERSLSELAALAETAGARVVHGLTQRRSSPDPATFIGSGKVAELADLAESADADTVVFDGELSPAQLARLSERLQVKVIDRTALILDIFAQRATSREGKAQVRLAQMRYMLPRLRGWGQSLARQRGGGGGGGLASRGPGETKLETDRRRLRDDMAEVQREIEQLRVARDLRRQRRERNRVPSVALAGYTNAGKSSLLNRLTGAEVLVRNALFATLDPTVRRVETDRGRGFTLTDTVGFVRRLPHHLVDAFRSTLEEVTEADLILHVVDGSHPDPLDQIATVRAVIADIGGARVPELVVVNKADAVPEEALRPLLAAESDTVVVSARTGEGVDALLERIVSTLSEADTEVAALLPYDRGDLLARIHDEGEVLAEEHTGDGTRVTARVHDALAAALEPYAG
ncbi:GTPase HflX [Nocardiopsis sp. EMB25]|uniref:GTPase HflX n=1 Tax=Nocardiopsis sp. EMB25 TaxID=2835867 RepID=UPI0022833703|nr:GTPase HflX [Nocardiopsis sp. EMB25]MCY9787290.1 GTPase HflX [Nocardiopsis sp. EMB25]